MRFWKPTLIVLLTVAPFSCGLHAMIECISHKEMTTMSTLTQDAIIKALGWVSSNDNRCGGYYLEPPIEYPKNLVDTNKLLITSEQGVFSFHGTSISQGKVTITRAGQQITANKAYLARNPQTGKLSHIDLSGNVRLREPNQLVLGSHLHYDLINSSKSLEDILYRSTIYSNNSNREPVSYEEQQEPRKVVQLSAWGQASSFMQNEPKIFYFNNASYSTCPPTSNEWKVKAKSLELNKISGRGTAKDAKLYIKGVPVFYAPYFNFPIDARRQTGFLSPRIGNSNRFGPFLMAPFYWNLAPNYDTTITPAYLTKSGLQLSDNYRYLTKTRTGQFNITVLPNDRLFNRFQNAQQEIYQNSTDAFTQSTLRQLQNDSTTRKAFSWQETGHYDQNWSSSINYNYVGDAYYLRDFNSNIDQVTENQLLQQAEVDYAGPHWNFLSRLQSYETLNQVDQQPVPASYSRVPQFVFGASYPDDRYGLEYFINDDVTRFDIRNSPGDARKLPMGTRFHVQPGIGRPINLPYFYFTPRVQFAMTQYEVSLVTNTPKTPSRTIPIFDVNSGFYFDRDTSWFGQPFKQTLEPQIYYTFIPFKDQTNLPLFDTTLNTLTYDQLFTYNRFSGLDRIGDANQISLGVTTRYIDPSSGFEKIAAGIGEIYYFKKRNVTLCTNPDNCVPYENDPNNRSIHSPLSGTLKYSVNPDWNATANSIWNNKTTQLDNQNITLQYKPSDRKIINLGYNFVRAGDLPLPWSPPGTPATNLSQTDVSFSWPITRDWGLLGRWTENWNQKHLQNLLSGLQYDSCCWAVRLVAGRTFVALRPSNTFQYDKQFYVEFSLKGLGNYGPGGDASALLTSSIAGYQSNFGRDY